MSLRSRKKIFVFSSFSLRTMACYYVSGINGGDIYAHVAVVYTTAVKCRSAHSTQILRMGLGAPIDDWSEAWPIANAIRDGNKTLLS